MLSIDRDAGSSLPNQKQGGNQMLYNPIGFNTNYIVNPFNNPYTISGVNPEGSGRAIKRRGQGGDINLAKHEVSEKNIRWEKESDSDSVVKITAEAVFLLGCFEGLDHWKRFEGFKRKLEAERKFYSVRSISKDYLRFVVEKGLSEIKRQFIDTAGLSFQLKTQKLYNVFRGGSLLSFWANSADLNALLMRFENDFLPNKEIDSRRYFLMEQDAIRLLIRTASIGIGYAEKDVSTIKDMLVDMVRERAIAMAAKPSSIPKVNKSRAMFLEHESKKVAKEA
jgi:hypothetical protein